MEIIKWISLSWKKKYLSLSQRQKFIMKYYIIYIIIFKLWCVYFPLRVIFIYIIIYLRFKNKFSQELSRASLRLSWWPLVYGSIPDPDLRIRNWSIVIYTPFMYDPPRSHFRMCWYTFLIQKICVSLRVCVYDIYVLVCDAFSHTVSPLKWMHW